MITESLLKQLSPKLKNIPEWVVQLNTLLPHYNINTNIRVAAFLSQTAHESAGFTRLVENLNYSSSGLLTVFSKYFTKELAEKYARKPELIANRVYGNRMGNGDEASGDGYKFRGRGILQVTGKNNYEQLSLYLFKDSRLLSNPDYLITIEGAINSALWFWDKNKLNTIADTGDTTKLTKRINGGTNGLQDRQLKYNKIRELLD